MRVVPPLTVTDAILTSSTAAEPGAGETAWNGATAYAVGDVSYLAATHRKYERLVAGTTATSPDIDTTNWLDIGPTNRWKMFDLLRSTGTVQASPLTVVLTPGERIDAIGLVNLVADAVTITVTVSAVVVYTYTANLLSRPTSGWYSYFFGAFSYRQELALFDLPPFSGAVITVTLTRATGSVTCGGLVLGRSVYLGRTQYNATSDAENYSKITRDDFGNATLVPRRSVPKTSQTVRCKKSDVDRIRMARDDLNAVPALWSGLDDQDSGYFASFLILGIYKTFTINVDQPDDAMISLELEEV